MLSQDLWLEGRLSLGPISTVLALQVEAACLENEDGLSTVCSWSFSCCRRKVAFYAPVSPAHFGVHPGGENFGIAARSSELARVVCFACLL
jgi:hypothetical protein